MLLSAYSTFNHGLTVAQISAQIKTTIINNADSIVISVPNGSGGTTTQNVRRLNAFKAVSSVVFTTGTAPGGISITGFRTGFTLPNNTKLTLPDSFAPLDATTQQTVTAIGNSAFLGCTQLSQITIPDKVATIGANAFKDCTSLTIYPEVDSKQSGWHNNWNSSNCPVVWGTVHYHNFATHIWRNGTSHISHCSCGGSEIRGHVVSGGSGSGLNYFPPTQLCLHCGGVADMGFIQLGIIMPTKILQIGQKLAPDGKYYPNESFYIGDILVLNYEETQLYLELYQKIEIPIYTHSSTDDLSKLNI